MKDEYDRNDIMAAFQLLNSPQDVTCIRCGRVGRAVSRAEAERQVAETNAFIDSLPTSEQARHTRAALDMYRCVGCGGTEFRPAHADDCPDGVTNSPVIYEPNTAT